MSEIWKPEKGDQYYFMDSVGDIVCDPLGDFTWMSERIAMGNCFKTREEAEAAAEKVKEMLLSLQDTAQPTTQVNIQVNTQVKKLPDWCRNGALAWENGDYFELEVIDEDHRITMKYSDGTEESVTSDYIGKHVKQARLRPYNEVEMKELVGKVVERNGMLELVAAYKPEQDDFKIALSDDWYYNTDLLYDGYTIDGHPCGKLEHLEDGEWVE